MSRVADLASKMVRKEELVDALTKAIINAHTNTSTTPTIQPEE